jgi:hypothetical protein
VRAGFTTDRAGWCCSNGPTRRKMAREDFPILNSLFHFDFLGRWDNKLEKIIRVSKKYETLHGGRVEYLPQLLYWAL